MRFVLFIVLMLAFVSFSDIASQTDWSGGGGVPGPITDWGNSYDVSSQVNAIIGGVLRLGLVLITPIEHTVDDEFDGPYSVYATDVDGDGDNDVLGAARFADDITWWENTDGTGTVWTEHTVDGEFDGAISVYATDVDGDGDTDVLGAAVNADDITWWENANGIGTVWMEYTVDGDFDYASSVYATDVDGDGDTDVLGAAGVADDITWWENTNGIGTVWMEHTVDGDFDAARSVYATDVDGDGDTDVLGAANFANDITWWENTNGIGTVWTTHTVDGDFNGAISVYATDVDGDGDADVLGAANYADDITWWENTDGIGTVWTEHTVDGDFNGAISVYATDVDGDGDTDVLGAALDAADITWWENSDTGVGIYWIEHTVDGDYNTARSVYATDVDGDGYPDVLGTGVDADIITWWYVMCYSAAGTLESSILNAGTVNCWELFLSTVQEPAGTSVGFQFRSSQDSTNMGAWSDTVFITGTSLSGILADSTNYLQYKVILQTPDSTITPILSDVIISYSTYVSIGESYTDDVDCFSLAPAQNPSFGDFAVKVSLPQSGIVELMLYDLAGRVISEYSQELPGGTHLVYFNNLAEGIYFCTMHAGDFTATEQVVILR